MFIKSVCQSHVQRSIFHGQLKRFRYVSAKPITSIPRFLLMNEAPKRHKSSNTSAAIDNNEPSLDIAHSMNTSFKRMENDSLVLLANLDSPPLTGAREEVLKRHIMSVDEVNYGTACETFVKMEKKNRDLSRLASLPYKIGIITSITAGIASFPLCFDLETAQWFNTEFVTTDVPEPADLETVLEVGSWTWNWMEPPLGQISFFLLCLQFSRSQIQNLGVNPYTERVKCNRAQKLCAAFPKYDKDIITAYSISSGLQG